MESVGSAVRLTACLKISMKDSCNVLAKSNLSRNLVVAASCTFKCDGNKRGIEYLRVGPTHIIQRTPNKDFAYAVTIAVYYPKKKRLKRKQMAFTDAYVALNRFLKNKAIRCLLPCA